MGNINDKVSEINALMGEGDSAVQRIARLAGILAQHTLTAYQQQIGEWSAKTFPKSTPGTTLIHLWREVEELGKALLSESKERVADEAADVLILLIQFCNRANIDLDQALQEKHAENLTRKWLPPNEEGVVYHDPTAE